MSRSSIEWLARPDTIPETWNPVTGCTPASLGCQNCYAARMAKRLKGMGLAKYANGFKVTCHERELSTPAHWMGPRTVFVCSMSDLFHEHVPTEFITAVFDVMEVFPEHTFILLTKRPKRLLHSTPVLWPPNVWAGVTVEHPDYLHRLDHLRQVPAAVRFVSFEPLLGWWFGDAWRIARGYLTRAYVHWVVVGAETGPGKRKMDEDSACLIMQKCKFEGVPFFFKRNNDGGRTLAGEMYQEWPR